MKKNKIIIGLTLGLGLFLSFKPLINTNAVLIDFDANAPTWDYLYHHDTTSNTFRLKSYNDNTGVIVPYTIPTTNQYHSDNFNTLTLGGINFPLSVRKVFDQPTTTWTFIGGTKWRPANGQLTIGNANTISSALKYSIVIQNTTANAWQIALNISDSSSVSAIWYQHHRAILNVPNGMGDDNTQGLFARRSSTLHFITINPGQQLDIGHSITTTTILFRGIAFKDLGPVNNPNNYQNGYTNGYTAGNSAGYVSGYNNGFLDGQDNAESNITSRISSLIRTAFNGVSGILDIKIFDDLTLGSVMLFPVALTIFFFIFRLIRGPKG
jgi:hypothetical protein